MQRGNFVTLQLNEPKEQLWGRLLEIQPAGITVRGFDVRLVEKFKYQFRGEPVVFPQTAFYPMHRVLRLFLDEDVGDVPSIIAAIQEVTRLDVDAILPIE